MSNERIEQLWALAMEQWLAEEADGRQLHQLFARLIEREVRYGSA
jgi:hypothetical protein